MIRQIFLKPFLWPACLCACLPVPGLCGGFSISGQTNAPENTNPSARAMALGSAFVGVADDASALFANPAGLAWLGKGEISANTNFWLVDTFQESLLLGLPLSPRWGGIGIAASYLDFGTFEGRDAAGSLAPNYGANLLYLKGGWGMEAVGHLAFGAGFEGIQSRLADSTYWDLALDAGILYQPLPGLRLGADFGGLGVNPDSGLDGGVFHLGASYEKTISSRDYLLASVEGSLGQGTVDYFQAGVEYGFNRLLFLRAGWQVPLGDNNTGGLTGLSAGLGFALSDFKMDYAYLPYGELGSAHRVSLGYAFGSPAEEKVSGPGPTIQPKAGNSEGKSPLPVVTRNGAGSPPFQKSPPAFRLPLGSATPSSATGRESMEMGGARSISGEEAPHPAGTTISGPVSAGMADNLSKESAPPSASASTATTVFVSEEGGMTPGPVSESARPTPPSGALGSVVPRPADSGGAGSNNPLDVDFDFTSDPVAEGKQLEQEGKYQEAAQRYRQVLQQNSQDVSAWKALGSLYFRSHQKEAAVKCFEEVLKLEPDNQKLADWLEKYKASNP